MKTAGTTTTIWKSDLEVFEGLKLFVCLWKYAITEYSNFYLFEGNFDPYEIIANWNKN